MSNDQGFTCTVTGAVGLEPEILRLRNANRRSAETLEYLTWRYEHSSNAPAPLVFWLVSPEGGRVGMAAVVFRAYWVNGERAQVAVVGDISLDVGLRGRGLGQRLLRYMTEYLQREFPRQIAFVIPTESARRALSASGWVTAGSLVPHVCVLDPAPRLRTLMRSARLGTALAQYVRQITRAATRLRVPYDCSLHCEERLDASLGVLVETAYSREAAQHELGNEFLDWRYLRHPNTHFRVARFTRSGETRGFLIFEDSTLDQSCQIYDLVAATAKETRIMLAMFVLRGLSMPGLVTLRVLLNDRHPCGRYLRGLGFIARRSEAVFQVYSPDGTAGSLAWRVTQGDKDT